jgi:hypothetical protein
MASGDADELERGGLLAGDEDGELDITSSVTDADVQDFKDRLWEAVPPAKAPKSVQFVAPEPEPEPEPELEADAHAEPEPEDSVRDGSLVRGTTLKVDEYKGEEERASPFGKDLPFCAFLFAQGSNTCSGFMAIFIFAKSIGNRLFGVGESPHMPPESYGETMG